jgi:NAD(P)-dependent dehydrogenase (short-subunit alcohol dehydrogenase family)
MAGGNPGHFAFQEVSMAGRIIVVTGAFGVLGSAVAAAAARQGATLALIDYAADGPAPDGALKLGGVDLADPIQTEQAIARVVETHGGLDALLNIAGGFVWQTLEGGPLDAWPGLYRLNTVTAATACRAAIPHLRNSAAGRIVNVGANAALKAGMGMGAYAASKAGVHALTQSLAEELKADNITVNAVLPSILDTPANRADMPDADPAAWVAPADLAEVMLFLAGEAAGAVTGALVPVTGRV